MFVDLVHPFAVITAEYPVVVVGETVVVSPVSPLDHNTDVIVGVKVPANLTFKRVVLKLGAFVDAVVVKATMLVAVAVNNVTELFVEFAPRCTTSTIIFEVPSQTKGVENGIICSPDAV